MIYGILHMHAWLSVMMLVYGILQWYGMMLVSYGIVGYVIVWCQYQYFLFLLSLAQCIAEFLGILVNWVQFPLGESIFVSQTIIHSCWNFGLEFGEKSYSVGEFIPYVFCLTLWNKIGLEASSKLCSVVWSFGFRI